MYKRQKQYLLSLKQNYQADDDIAGMIEKMCIRDSVYEERMRNARNLRVSSDVIVQATGLPEEEIKAL